VSLRALGTEIAKNLVLAGISSLTIIDDDLVTEEDLGAQYFLREEDVGKPV
jgi:ubiquitin-like 1-activating enzyme E1 A